MKNRDGAWIGVIGGSIYVPFVFVMGWEAGANIDSIGWLVADLLIIFAFIVPFVFWLPLSRIWLYPLMFALPTLLIGLLALSGGVPTILAIGFSTFLVGMAAAYLGQHLARLYRPALTHHSSGTR